MVGQADQHAGFSDPPVPEAALIASALFIDSITRGHNVQIT
jgi:hypothetical protein